MAHQVSHVHWRVQTRTPAGGWVTRSWPPALPAAIAVAEGYLEDLGVAARVLLGGTVYYFTAPERPAQEAAR